MRCPFCGFEETSVKDSRATDDNSTIRRRRVCLRCGSRFTTFERIQLKELFVIKKNSQVEPFDRVKLEKSIRTAFHKNSTENLDPIVSGIIRQLEMAGDTHLSSTMIGECVMEALAQVDPVAYIRFASIYHEFHSSYDFVEFLQKVQVQEFTTASKNQLKIFQEGT